MDEKVNISRPPIVTLMGHVDHGKTTLLDAFRKSNVVARESGGITQHIGAYQIIFHSNPITFIDTPGHAAFEKMRFRGAHIADIVVLVVAATEGVKKQTEEAIKHIKSAGKPIIVALTKVDLEGTNIEKVKKELQTKDIIAESYGGNVPMVEVSAPKNIGLDELLEVIQLVWQLNPQPSLSQDPLMAQVVESYLDKNRGPITTVIVKSGTLKVGQKLSVDGEQITVRALSNDQGKQIKEAIPGTPVEVLGFKKVLDIATIVSDTIESQKQTQKEPASIGDIIAKSQESKGRFKVIIKADVLGSLEAILENISDKALVIDSSVGEVLPNDVAFAKSTGTPILAFHTKIPPQVKNQAEREGVIIRSYSIIYELISDIEKVIEGFEQAKHELKITGKAKIIASFNIDGQKIAGIQVISGKLRVGDKVLFKVNEKELGNSQIDSIKKFKKDLDSVGSGQECGISLNPNIDFKIGDIIESLGPQNS